MFVTIILSPALAVSLLGGFFAEVYPITATDTHGSLDELRSPPKRRRL